MTITSAPIFHAFVSVWMRDDVLRASVVAPVMRNWCRMCANIITSSSQGVIKRLRNRNYVSFMNKIITIEFRLHLPSESLRGIWIFHWRFCKVEIVVVGTHHTWPNSATLLGTLTHLIFFKSKNKTFGQKIANKRSQCTGIFFSVRLETQLERDNMEIVERVAAHF